MTTYTVTDLAKLLHRSRSSVASLIASGRLKAFDAAPEGRLRQWRVTEEALQDFIAANSANSAKPPARARKRITRPRRQYV